MPQLSPRPKIFIGSSSNGIDTAKHIKNRLQAGGLCEPVLWEEDFPAGFGIYEQLRTKLLVYDFAIFVLTSDDQAVARGVAAALPRDNVIFELGLFVGGIGHERTFFFRDGADTNILTDLAGVTYFNFLPLEIEKAIEEIHARIKELLSRHGDFALCIPTHSDEKAGDFNRELKYYLMNELAPHGIKLIEFCPQLPSGGAAGYLEKIEAKIQEICQDKQHRFRYAFVLLPPLEDGQYETILNDLQTLASRGCRIAFMNEFPTIPDDGKHDDLLSARSLICLDEEVAADRLCKYIKYHLAPSGPVLVLNADQAYKTAVRRKYALLANLKKLNIPHECFDIPSWDEGDARRLLLRKLRDDAKSGLAPYEVILAANDSMAHGAESALTTFQEEQTLDQRLHKCWVTGFDGLPTAIRQIKDSKSSFAATIAKSPGKYAQKAVRVLFSRVAQEKNAVTTIYVENEDLVHKDMELL